MMPIPQVMHIGNGGMRSSIWRIETGEAENNRFIGHAMKLKKSLRNIVSLIIDNVD